MERLLRRRNSRWLFPGGQPGRPISGQRLGERLHQPGLRPAKPAPQPCSASPPNSPAALLARLLGINISVAVAWQRASSGDWTNYAADYSRRNSPNTIAEPANEGHS